MIFSKSYQKFSENNLNFQVILENTSLFHDTSKNIYYTCIFLFYSKFHSLYLRFLQNDFALIKKHKKEFKFFIAELSEKIASCL